MAGIFDKIIGQSVSELGIESALAEHEEILWQDRPVEGFHWNNEVMIGVGVGVLFMSGADKWLLKLGQSSASLWTTNPMQFLFGLLIVVASLFYPVFMRKNTWYTLTNRRAIITTKLPILGKRFKSYPITQDSKLAHKEGKFATVYFKETTRYISGKYRQTTPFGFEHIKEGEAVYNMLRNVKAGAQYR